MPETREYIISICATALICSLITPFLKKRPVGGMLPGLLLILTVLQPLLRIPLPSMDHLTEQYRYDAQRAVAVGEENSHLTISEIIKSKTAAYILQKADTLGLQLSVDVALTEDVIPIPQSVSIVGAAAPYAKKQLQELIQRDLGIAKENQVWISASG